MNFNNGKAENIKIAYIGGGSRGWAWGFMSDLVAADDISGDVYLYDIDYEAACHNEIIGNKFNDTKEAKTVWNYHAVETIGEALTGADFVIISILPGTFDEMASDVHTPEKYGIYQSVGDSTGPGGIVRAMRTVPMYEHIAESVKTYCPDAWVISYTNPMTLCVRTLYRVFPEIKAYGCCHEVFGTQKILVEALKKMRGIEPEDRSEIKSNPVGVNHFTWITNAHYKNIDLFPVYKEFADKYSQTGYTDNLEKDWKTNPFRYSQRVKLDLFNRYGYIAAAGDRHLAEFCDGTLYLKDPETVNNWDFGLTKVDWRKNDLKERLEKSRKYRTGEKPIEVVNTGEEGVHQIRALLGLCDLVTNVNLPNRGQISNLPLGAVVETNAVFRSGEVTPVIAGAIPEEIYYLVSRICLEQEKLNHAYGNRDAQEVFECFVADPLVTCSDADARKLFTEMLENTKDYLTSYDLSEFIKE